MSIPNGNGNGKCMECGKKVEAEEFGYYGNREARFYCRKHLKERWEVQNPGIVRLEGE